MAGDAGRASIGGCGSLVGAPELTQFRDVKTRAMPRTPSAPIKLARSDVLDGDSVVPEEYQWWTRIIFVALSAVFAVLMFSLLRSFVTLQDYAGAM